MGDSGDNKIGKAANLIFNAQDGGVLANARKIGREASKIMAEEQAKGYEEGAKKGVQKAMVELEKLKNVAYRIGLAAASSMLPGATPAGSVAKLRSMGAMYAPAVGPSYSSVTRAGANVRAAAGALGNIPWGGMKTTTIPGGGVRPISPIAWPGMQTTKVSGWETSLAAARLGMIPWGGMKTTTIPGGGVKPISPIAWPGMQTTKVSGWETSLAATRLGNIPWGLGTEATLPGGSAGKAAARLGEIFWQQGTQATRSGSPASAAAERLGQVFWQQGTQATRAGGAVRAAASRYNRVMWERGAAGQEWTIPGGALTAASRRLRGMRDAGLSTAQALRATPYGQYPFPAGPAHPSGMTDSELNKVATALQRAEHPVMRSIKLFQDARRAGYGWTASLQALNPALLHIAQSGLWRVRQMLWNVVNVWQRAMGMMKRASEIEPALVSFQALTASMGGAHKYMQDLTKATGGYLNQASLATVANKFLASGIQTNSTEMGEAMRMMRLYAYSIGKDGEQAVEQFGEAIARGETRLLKFNGIALDSRQLIREYAEAHGVTALEVSKSTQLQLIYNAAIKELKSKTAGLTEEMFPMANAYAKLDVTMKNIRDKIALMLASNPAFVRSLENIATAFGNSAISAAKLLTVLGPLIQIATKYPEIIGAYLGARIGFSVAGSYGAKWGAGIGFGAGVLAHIFGGSDNFNLNAEVDTAKQILRGVDNRIVAHNRRLANEMAAQSERMDSMDGGY